MSAAQTDKELKAELIKQGEELGLSIHPNTSLANMIQMVNMGLIFSHHKAPDAPIKSVVIKDKVAARRQAEKLVRVKVSNLDPTKKAYSAQAFGFSNSVVGTIRKVVPFDVDEGFHIPEVLLDVIRNVKHRVTKYRTKIHGGSEVQIPYSVEVSSYGIEILPALSADELEVIKQRQLAQQTMNEQ